MTEETSSSIKSPSLVTKKIVLLPIVAAVLLVMYFLLPLGSEDGSDKPLYWVAPMDANYRRDGPGKSPMGMDLIPVYEADLAGASSDNPGAVHLSAEVQKKLGVRTREIEMGQLTTELRTFAKVTYDETRDISMTSRVSGWIDLLFVRSDGEKVREGQPLFALSSDQLVKAQEKLLAAQMQGNSYAQFYAQDELRSLGVDDITIDTIIRDGAPQQNIIFKAPNDGVLNDLNIAEGAAVKSGQTLLTIKPLDRLWVEMNVFESQAQQIEVNQTVELTSPQLPGHAWKTELDYIAPQMSYETQTRQVRATLSNQDGLLIPNMFLQADIQITAKQSKLLAPLQAIIQLGKQNRAVLALEDGFFKSIEVTLGRDNGEFVEVQEGLKEGDRIVTSAQFLIDSESSKTSDFTRMQKPEVKIREAQVEAKVLEINSNENILRLQHEPIDDWNMPSMTMNFKVDQNVEFQQLKEQDTIVIDLLDHPDESLYVITKIRSINGVSQ